MINTVCFKYVAAYLFGYPAILLYNLSKPTMWLRAITKHVFCDQIEKVLGFILVNKDTALYIWLFNTKQLTFVLFSSAFTTALFIIIPFCIAIIHSVFIETETFANKYHLKTKSSDFSDILKNSFLWCRKALPLSCRSHLWSLYQQSLWWVNFIRRVAGKVTITNL